MNFRKDLSDSEKEIYLDGAVDALMAFSIWNNGRLVINTEMMRTPTEATEIIKKEINYGEKSSSATSAKKATAT